MDNDDGKHQHAGSAARCLGDLLPISPERPLRERRFFAPLLIVLVATACPVLNGGDAGRSDSGDRSGADAGSEELLLKSGSRLRVRRYVTKGATMFNGFWDPVTRSACSFVLTSDAGYRCQPYSERGAPVGFLDDTCTNAFLSVTCSDGCESYCSPMPKYFIAPGRSAGTCAGAVDFQLYEVQAEIAPPSARYTRYSHTMCAPGPPPARGERVFAATPVSPDVLLEGTVEQISLGATLAANVVVGSDGSRVMHSLVDRVRDAGCEVRPVWNGSVRELRCVPASAARTTDLVYSDANCATLAARDDKPAACGAPPVALKLTPHTVSDACTDTTASLYSVGSRIDSFWQTWFGTCAPTPSSSYSLYKLGQPLPPSDYPLLRPVRLGTGRIQVVRLTNSDGAPASVAWRLWDSDGDEPCEYHTLVDGGGTCVPHSFGAFTTHTDRMDPACSQFLVTGALNRDCSATLPRAAVEPHAACQFVLAGVRDVLAEYTDPNAHFKLPDGGCLTTSWPTEQPGSDLKEWHYTLGPVLDPVTRLGTLSLIIE